MAERVTARHLLGRARELYDCPASGLAGAATGAWRGGFASGGRWMALALGHLRGAAPPERQHPFTMLGCIKYGLACTAAVPAVVLAVGYAQPLALLLCVPLFYTVEAQMVFLFPLVIDGRSRPFRTARRWTRRAGGTLAVMAVVLPVAATMLFGGLVGRGFVRSWCLGCLAVCLWYESLRLSDSLTPVPAS